MSCLQLGLCCTVGGLLLACAPLPPAGFAKSGGSQHCHGNRPKCEVKVWVSKVSDLKCLIESVDKVAVGRPDHTFGPLPDAKKVRIIWVIDTTQHLDQKIFRFAANGIDARAGEMRNEFESEGNDNGEGSDHRPRRFKWKSLHPTSPSPNGAKYSINVQMQSGNGWVDAPVNCTFDPIITNHTEALAK